MAGPPVRRWRWACGLAAAVLVTGAAPAAPGPAITIGAEDAAAPWSKPDGQGYVNDLVRAAFAESGWTVALSVVPYPRCKAQVVAGRLAACFSMSRTPELEASLLFPRQPVFNAQNVLVARADSAWSGCDPARWGERPVIGLVRGYEYQSAVDVLLNSGRVRAESASSEVGNLRKVRAGHVGAGLVTLDEVKRLDYLLRLAGLPVEFKSVCDFGAAPAYVAFSRAHPQGREALAAFEAGYARLVQRGAVAALQAQWRVRALSDATATQR